ncbi:4'-phosphopantetheinyl transferase superfamily [Acrodontium crateriforme]|uniref:holo-[acyl-carrier-protein] synthase n=1 Tax=Acrodontium crateriforme TaxID=150365 RepID=A0AAQ3MC11_9PEZI|nr:4'-phosphopantetheinyl transferase superfamily [Acrodontium crateriforme]
MSIIDNMKEHFLHIDIPLSARQALSGLEPQPQHEPDGDVVCWLLDTRNMWPGTNIYSASGAAACMSLVSLEEQNTIGTKMFIADAKMSLASALLKRLFVSTALEIPWKEVQLARKGNEKHGKPCAVDDMGRPIAGIDFNVSHQNGLVSLIGWNGRKQQLYSPTGHIMGILSPLRGTNEIMVGVDIVCVNERQSASNTIDIDGFDGWVDVYESIFSDEERWSMKYDVDYVTLLDGTVLTSAEVGRHDRCLARHTNLSVTTAAGRNLSFSSELLIDAKLRRFYTYFCYKEAYIKLTGEALLAPWLRQLEFHNVRSPKPGVVARCSSHGVWGEEVDDVEVKLEGRIVTDVKMKIQSYEEDFMIATAIQGEIQNISVPHFRKLDLERDILPFSVDQHHTASKSAPDVITPWERRYF